MKTWSKTMAILLAFFIPAALLGGCGTSGEAKSEAPPDVTAAVSASPETAPSEESEPTAITYPLTDGYTFTCWWPNDLALSGVENYNDTPWFQFMEKQTGVHLDFKNPNGQQAAEQYNLMLVSGDVADFIRQMYIYHTRGLDDAVEAGWICDLMDFKEDLPNLFGRLDASQELYIQSVTDGGRLAGFPMLMSQSENWVNGLFIRQDWLDKYGLQKPHTLDEFEHVLEVFRDNEPSAAKGPMWMNNKMFTGIDGTFGINMYSNFFYRDGTVRASVLEDGYREYIQTLAEWYSRGLISNDSTTFDGFLAIMDTGGWLGGKWGITYDCFVYLDDMNAQGENGFKMVPLEIPVKNAGDTIHTLYSDRMSWPGALGISQNCSNMELACRYWDYCYSEEGSIHANFGEEGLTYKMGADGKPHYTDFAARNPEMNPNQVQNYYMMLDGPYYRIGGRTYEAISKEEQQCGVEWTKGDNSYTLPANLALTAEEGNKKATIMSDVSSYIDENQVLFVNGQRSMDEFDSFIDGIRSLGIEEVVAIYQTALDRYNNRINLIKK